MKKFNKEKIKQYSLIIISVMLIGIGYMNYNYEPTIEVVATETQNSDDETLGDVQLVSANSVTEEIVSNDEQVLNQDDNQSSDEYFSASRLDRETMYSQMIEVYQNMVNSNEISQEQKSIAIQEITNITKIKNGIMIAENLIKNKGFEDVVILVSNNNASIVIKSVDLSLEQISQIQNIVCRELSIDVSNITITTKI